jgi:hypothetical protein
MQESGAYGLAVVCEADADRRIATALADRVLCRDVEWIEPDSLGSHRRWRGLDSGSSHLEWHEAKAKAGALGRKAHGDFKGRPGAPDAFAARRALLLLMSRQLPDAVVLVRDADRQLERRTGLEQAREDRAWPFPVIIGLAIPKRESWVLAGFEPQEALAQARRETGDLKRVLELLVGDDYDREQACWTECPLEILTERGQFNGLTEYLEEVRTRLVPLFTGREVS